MNTYLSINQRVFRSPKVLQPVLPRGTVLPSNKVVEVRQAACKILVFSCKYLERKLTPTQLGNSYANDDDMMIFFFYRKPSQSYGITNTDSSILQQKRFHNLFSSLRKVYDSRTTQSIKNRHLTTMRAIHIFNPSPPRLGRLVRQLMPGQHSQRE